MVDLQELFDKQTELDCRTGFDANKVKGLSTHEITREVRRYMGWRLNDLLIAMSNEIEELRDCTFWKHWCIEAQEGRRFELFNLQNARVEVIDMFFFWMGLALALGLDAEKIKDLYEQKLKVNHKRQDNKYSMMDKTEDDNKQIQ